MLRYAASSSSEFAHRGMPRSQVRGNPILFCDFDGPIIDVSDRYYQTYQLGLAEIQAHHRAMGAAPTVRALSKAQFWELKRERVSDYEIATRSGLQQEEVPGFLERVCEIVNQPNLLRWDRLQPDAEDALVWLHTAGVRLVLVTLRCQRQATQILESHGLAHLFSRICGTSDCQTAYQNNACLKTHLLQSLLAEDDWQDWRSHTTWMAGDTEADILAGQAVDMPTIALTCGIRSDRYLQRFQPTRTYPNLHYAACALLTSNL